jgi:PIN domain
MSESVFFLDTNVILQCRDLEELPWSELTPADTIRLVLPGIVCDQLDRLKNDCNSRRARRARKASSRCDEILDSEDQKIVIRRSSPAVTLELEGAKPKATDFPDLDLSYEDHRLIAETLNFARANPSLDVRLLTDDVGPKMTAKRQRLPYTSVPEGWRLAPENDSRDKELAQARQEIEGLRSNYASIAVHLEVEGERPEKVSIKLPGYRPLEETQIDELMETAEARFPMSTAAVHQWNPTQPVYIPPQNRQIYAQEYSTWLNDLRAFLVSVHEKLNTRDQRKTLAFVLDCNGVRPAEQVIAEITASGDILLQHVDVYATDGGNIVAPRPPRLGFPKNQFPQVARYPTARRSIGSAFEFHYSGQPTNKLTPRYVGEFPTTGQPKNSPSF